MFLFFLDNEEACNKSNTNNTATDSNLKNTLPTMSIELNIGMDFQLGHIPANNLEVRGCHMQVHPSGKLHPRGDATSEPYKPAFHGGHLSRNTSYGSAVTLWVFRLPWRRYSYSTQSSMTELILSVSQHWNFCSE